MQPLWLNSWLKSASCSIFGSPDTNSVTGCPITGCAILALLFDWSLLLSREPWTDADARGGDLRLVWIRVDRVTGLRTHHASATRVCV